MSSRMINLVLVTLLVVSMGVIGYLVSGIISSEIAAAANSCQLENVCGDGRITGTEKCDNGGICTGSSRSDYEGGRCFNLDPSGNRFFGVQRCIATGGTCVPQHGDGCASDCSEDCYTNGAPCFIDSDCGACTDAQCSNGVCVEKQVCVPSGGVEVCDVRGDEECDGVSDCYDTVDCSGSPVCNGCLTSWEVIDCSDTGTNPNWTSCDLNSVSCIDGSCICPWGESSETTCDDGKDNDCDGVTDSEDPDCDGEWPIACGDLRVEGAEACDDGNTTDGDGCSSTCANEDLCDLDGGCPSLCGTSAVNWQFDINGLSNDTCGYCEAINGTHVIEYIESQSGDCEYSWLECTQCDSLFIDLVLTDILGAQLSFGTVRYRHPVAGLNCNGSNVLTLDPSTITSPDECNGWPNEITVTPIGSVECRKESF